MKFPNLVLNKYCNCVISGSVYSEGVSEDGGPISHNFENISCNYQSGGKTYLSDYQKIVEVSGSIYISGDPFPEVSEITGGTVIVDGIEREIYKGIKGRNPDNTVNFVKLELK